LDNNVINVINRGSETRYEIRASCRGFEATMHAQYLELYNEDLRDLLATVGGDQSSSLCYMQLTLQHNLVNPRS
jgi:hypothetical protein